MFTMALLTAAWNFTRAHWKPFALAAALGFAFLYGRCGAPKPKALACPAVQTQKTETQQQATVQVDQHRDEQRQEHRKVETRRDVFAQAPDAGCTLVEHDDTTETDDSGDAVATDTHEHATEAAHAATQTAAVRSDAPRWNLGLSVGAPLNLRHPLEVVPDGMADFSYHFWGPLSVEAWGSSPLQRWAPTFGLRLRGEVSW